MSKIGIVEGFFGPEWEMNSRKSWAEFLKSSYGSFYIYAPKRDANLRKNWRESWSEEYVSFLKDLSSHFQSHGIKFGVGFSPFGLGTILTDSDKSHILSKAQLLKSIGIDIIGIFFDDMPVTDNLLSTQKEVLEVLRKTFNHGIVFCPSFYSYDPILDKVFGQRPDGYVESLKYIDSSIDICWTGPKVISEQISDDHLAEVSLMFERKPFLWENLYANDGPRNCKFLKLKYFEGRENLLENISGLSFNLMNQSELSKILYLSSVKVLKNSMMPSEAFKEAVYELCGDKLGKFILDERVNLLEKGLDNLEEGQRDSMLERLSSLDHPVAKEITDYLNGQYLVGPECLTD